MHKLRGPHVTPNEPVGRPTWKSLETKLLCFLCERLAWPANRLNRSSMCYTCGPLDLCKFYQFYDPKALVFIEFPLFESCKLRLNCTLILLYSNSSTYFDILICIKTRVREFCQNCMIIHNVKENKIWTTFISTVFYLLQTQNPGSF